MKERFKKTFLGKWLLSVKRAFPIAHPKYSYSQVGEDVILDSFLEYKKIGFYVDVGAFDPKDISNTYKFYKRGWNGIQIEPNYKRAQLFKRYRPRTTTLNVGIGTEEKIQPFYLFEEESLSTFSKEVAELNTSLGNTLIETPQVQLMPLHKVFEQYAKDILIDILSVDTEGFDLEVLKTNDWNIFRPRFIIVETSEYSKEVFGKKLNDEVYDPYMKSIGYETVADTYLNTIYVDSSNKQRS